MMLKAQAYPIWQGITHGGITRVDPIVGDFKLAQQSAKGDMNAFGELYLRYKQRVYALCLRMTRNVAEAEDLTQEAFIQLFRKIKTFSGESLFPTWLHRLTVN